MDFLLTAHGFIMFSFLKRIFGRQTTTIKKDTDRSQKDNSNDSQQVLFEVNENRLSTKIMESPLSPEFEYLKLFIQERLDNYFGNGASQGDVIVPATQNWSLYIPVFLNDNNLSSDEKTLLLLALCPHVHSDLFDRLIQDRLPKAGDFPQLGGTRGKIFRGFLPTGETALFLLAGDDPGKRKEIQQLFDPDSFFPKNRILWLEDVPEGEPVMSGRIIMSQEYIDLLTGGKITRPAFSLRFPAQRVETGFEWNDLVLNEETMDQIKELRVWLEHGKTLLDHWQMHKKLKPGYRVLFHGPPGTGKTLTASLLGKYTGREVYKIDLSMVVSKFIGETEKNLANLFTKAENKDWLLFFDEADALFGKRTSVRDAHDKYANQEVSYLLQRIEDYNGLVILASNFKSNIDDAFIRRFQSVIHFPPPTASERQLIWQKAFPENVLNKSKLPYSSIAGKYELTGAEIMNVVQFCCLRALDRGEDLVSEEDVIDGVRKEYRKEGKIMR